MLPIPRPAGGIKARRTAHPAQWRVHPGSPIPRAPQYARRAAPDSVLGLQRRNAMRHPRGLPRNSATVRRRNATTPRRRVPALPSTTMRQRPGPVLLSTTTRQRPAPVLLSTTTRRPRVLAHRSITMRRPVRPHGRRAPRSAAVSIAVSCAPHRRATKALVNGERPRRGFWKRTPPASVEILPGGPA